MPKSLKDRLSLLFAWSVLVSSLFAAGCYVILGVRGFNLDVDVSSRRIRNYFIDVWFCLLLAFLAFEGLILLSQNPLLRHGKTYVVLNNAYFVMMAILCLEMAASWDVYGRGDVATWNALCIAFNIFNIYVLTSRNIKHKKSMKIIEPTSEKSYLIPLSSSCNDTIADDPDEIIPAGKGDGKGADPPRIYSAKRRQYRESSSPGTVMRCCSTLNAVAKTTVLLFTVLLFHGAILHGMGTQSFAPSQDAAIVLSSGVHVFYRCQRGNSTDENDFPGVTVVLHGNPDQGMGDFMGLSDMLIDEGTAVCVWDRPGIGFSGYALAENIRHPEDDLVSFLTQLSAKEKNFSAPYFLVGFGEGGEDVLRVSRKTFSVTDNSTAEEVTRPLVSNVLLVDSLPRDFYQRALPAAGEGNLTVPDADAVAERTFREELSLLRLYDRLLVPLGLTRATAASKNTAAWSRQESKKAQRWYDVTEKTWLARYVRAWDRLQGSKRNGKNQETQETQFPVDVIMSAWSNEQVALLVCSPNGLSASDCRLQQALRQLAADEKRATTANGGSIRECSLDECYGEHYFVYDDPGFVARAVQEILVSLA